MPNPPHSLSPAAIALNRFGLGVRPDAAALTDPPSWIVDQFARFEVRSARYAALADAGVIIARYREQQQADRQKEAGGDATDATATLRAGRQDFRQDVQALYAEGVRARRRGARDRGNVRRADGALLVQPFPRLG